MSNRTRLLLAGLASLLIGLIGGIWMVVLTIAELDAGGPAPVVITTVLVVGGIGAMIASRFIR
ncbi:hypothetical protein [Jannaschia sp. CCS1]|uniref:hypothetical protein n=1 Tax=Jannaschia sp. (strain CCS1) TaxID=290400 RepID=UPI0002E98ED0|nr:hypothetical protein [Jannaschia sp. CCS1]